MNLDLREVEIWSIMATRQRGANLVDLQNVFGAPYMNDRDRAGWSATLKRWINFWPERASLQEERARATLDGIRAQLGALGKAKIVKRKE